VWPYKLETRKETVVNPVELGGRVTSWSRVWECEGSVIKIAREGGKTRKVTGNGLKERTRREKAQKGSELISHWSAIVRAERGVGEKKALGGKTMDGVASTGEKETERKVKKLCGVAGPQQRRWRTGGSLKRGGVTGMGSEGAGGIRGGWGPRWFE